MRTVITSTSNKEIKNLNKCLKNARERRKQDLFIVEGVRMFSEIPKSLLLKTYVTETFYDAHVELFKDISYEFVSDHVLNAITDTRTPQGVVSMVKRPHYTKEEVCAGDNPLIMALENLQDPGNVGTIFRTAEGAGVTGILLSHETVDVYNPKVVRSTMGSIFRIPFAYVEDLTQTITDLQNQGFSTYSAHLMGESFYDYDYTGPTVFAIGNEGNGLSKELSVATKYKIKIPMQGQVESLNAATASTVLMYEAMRQRIM